MAQYFPDQTPSGEPLVIDGTVVEQNPGSVDHQAVKGKEPARPPEPQAAPKVNVRDMETVWARRNLLTFDGGGIRGYWSLLVMCQLMDHVYALEMNPWRIPCLQNSPFLIEKSPHSFHPLSYEAKASQLGYTKTEQRYRRIYSRADDEVEALDPARRYLPCHYFDYIGGTSTGALIAIMLSRFRMTVLDCLHEYAHFGDAIFGNPRRFANMRMYIGSGTKLRASDAEAAYQEVTKMRAEETAQHATTPRFPSEKHMCNTFVTALHAIDRGVQSRPYVIRSYGSVVEGDDSPIARQASMSEVRQRTVYGYDPTGTDVAKEPQLKERKLYEDAHDLEIYQVARAATAAPRHHAPQKIRNAKGQEMVFEDAGIVDPNPTPVGLAEIRRIHENYPGIVVSVGTAKADHLQEKEAGKESILETGKRVGAIVTDPDAAHDQVRVVLKRKGVPYYRLNPDKESAKGHRLNIPMDDWEPKKSSNGDRPGEATLRGIRQRFDAWYDSSDKIKEQFSMCASELVARRRLRAYPQQSAARWERYIRGSTFECPVDPCTNDRKFTFHDKLIQHCKSKHPEAQLSDDELLKRARNNGWSYQEGELANVRIV